MTDPINFVETLTAALHEGLRLTQTLKSPSEEMHYRTSTVSTHKTMLHAHKTCILMTALTKY